MNHWGWYWKIKQKHVSRVLCSKLPMIDSFNFYKEDTMMGFTVKPLKVVAEPKADHLIVTYGKRKEHSYIIPVDKLACNYGGFRYFFKCPLCKKRMRFLYFPQQSVFLCRKCLNLSYPSQQLRPTLRYQHMNQKVKDLVKAKGGDLDLHQKPPKMRDDTYQKLRNKQFYYESKSHQALNKELREWYSPKIDQYLDEYFDYVDESKEWRRK